MKISEASRQCGLSVHTIRFYEKAGMLPSINRGKDGHRSFNAKELEWLTLLYWLRETGMPLRQMKRFTFLAKNNAQDFRERREILLQHSETLKRKRKTLKRCEEVLAKKLESYPPQNEDDQQ